MSFHSPQKRPKTNRVGRLTVAAAVIVAVVGCSASPTAPHEPAPSVSVEQSPSLTPWQAPSVAVSQAEVDTKPPLPMQQYVLGEDEMVVQRAWTILINQCMEKAGAKYRQPPPPELSKEYTDLSYQRWGVESLALAQQYGYRDETQTPEGVASIQARVDAPGPPDSEASILYGSGPIPETVRFHEGCMGEAEMKLSEGTTTVALAGMDRSPIVRDVLLDPRAAQSDEADKRIAVFAQCMADAGYPDVKSPTGRPQKFERASLDNLPVSSDEIKAATIQFECQESSGATKALREAETQFQLAAIEKNPEAFATIKSELEMIVRKATEVVANG